MFSFLIPQDEKERTLFAQTIGADGHLLLSVIYSQAPEWLGSIPAVETMRQIWVQQYYKEGKVHWRTKGNLPPSAVMISSPHDTDARYSSKREKTWVGYKVHLTETCDQSSPHLITSVQTTVGTEPYNKVTEKIHDDLNERELLPSEHLADMSYGSVELLLSSHCDWHFHRLVS